MVLESSKEFGPATRDFLLGCRTGGEVLVGNTYL